MFDLFDDLLSMTHTLKIQLVQCPILHEPQTTKSLKFSRMINSSDALRVWLLQLLICLSFDLGSENSFIPLSLTHTI